MLPPPPFWTSTQFQNWKADCARHITLHQSFEVRDVYRPENETFCALLCEQNQYAWERISQSIFCTPTVSNPAGEIADPSDSGAAPHTSDQPRQKTAPALRPSLGRLGNKTARSVLRG